MTSNEEESALLVQQPSRRYDGSPDGGSNISHHLLDGEVDGGGSSSSNHNGGSSSPPTKRGGRSSSSKIATFDESNLEEGGGGGASPSRPSWNRSEGSGSSRGASANDRRLRASNELTALAQEIEASFEDDEADAEAERKQALADEEYFEFHNKRTQGTFLSTTANTLCTMVGGGLLALPLACSRASVVWFLIILVICAGMCIMSCYTLTVCCDASGRYTFQGMVNNALRLQFPALKGQKKAIAKIVESFIWLNNLCVLVIFMQVIGTTMPPVISHILQNQTTRSTWDCVMTGQWFWIGISAGLFLLTALFKTLRDLMSLSILGFLSMVFISMVVSVSFGIDANRSDSTQVLDGPMRRGSNATLNYFMPDEVQNLLPAFSIIVMSFTVQMNIPMLYFELGKKRSRRHMVGTTVVSYIVATILFASVGVCGYLHFGSSVDDKSGEGNILLNYGDNYMPMTIGRCLVYVRFVCAFPIVLSVGRRSVSVVFLGKEQPHWQPRTVITFMMVAIATLLGGFLPRGFGMMMEYVGAIFGTSVALTIPALLYVLMFPVIRQSEPETPRRRQYIAMVVVVFGTLLSISSVASTTARLA